MAFCPAKAGEAFSASDMTGEFSCEGADIYMEAIVIGNESRDKNKEKMKMKMRMKSVRRQAKRQPWDDTLRSHATGREDCIRLISHY